ncbi:MAG: SDR family oxidoreductase [Vicinamibacteria bacterium]|jgi:dTDP-4-dehydrorhamnose reductase|nr:SDR family oxidoreductase [Vicinamibacteria bacterium]
MSQARSGASEMKMRVLVLGGRGMLGHKLVERLQSACDVWTTVRCAAGDFTRYGLIADERIVGRIDAEDDLALVRALDQARPQVVVNCVGLVKQLPAARDPRAAIAINALLPHRLAALCRPRGIRLVHISTDCVFAGRRGHYSESDIPDAEDLYGRTKALGEIDGAGCLTLRTSIIGRELYGAHGLVEWFLAQPGPVVPGYTRAIFSGLTTLAFADALALVIARCPQMQGVYQVAAQTIDKYSLLVGLREAFGRDLRVEPRADVSIDRSLDGSRFTEQAGWTAPDWPRMLAALAADARRYEDWRR